MGLCIVAQLPGRTAADYEAIVKEIAPGGLPKGVVSQVVGTSAEGVTVITVWDTDDAALFVKDRVKPALDQRGIKANVSMLQVARHYQRG